MRIQPEISSPTHKEIVQSCGSCRYYQSFPEEPDDEDDDDKDNGDEDEDDAEPADAELITGVCRRYPPHPSSCSCHQSLFPEVSARSGWCGEYTPL